MSNTILHYLKKIYLKIWSKLNSYKGNVHLDSESSILKKIPFSAEKIYMRPTKSDCGRIVEFNNSIYFQNNFWTLLSNNILTIKIKKIKIGIIHSDSQDSLREKQ